MVGKDLKLTLGAKANGKGYSAPVLDDNVIIGTGACVLDNVNIGDNVGVGANAVVLTDIPTNS